MKPFDLEAAKAGAPLITRGGFRVTFGCHFPQIKDFESIACLVEGDREIKKFSITGSYRANVKDHLFDLFMAPQKVTRWVNFYKKGSNALCFESASEAKVSADTCNPDRLLAVAVKVEFDV